MQFISQGAQLITDNFNLARKRMFLMTADVVRPTATTGLSELMSKLDKARSFSHQRLEDGTLNCTRAAGWSGNRYYHTLVGPMRYDWSDEGSGSSTTYLNSGTFDITEAVTFARIYSIGAVPSPADHYKGDTGTMHDTVSARYESPDSPGFGAPVLILPPFEGQIASGSLFSTTDAPITNITASSGNIGSIGQFENRSARYVQTFYIYKDSSASQLRSFSYVTTALNNYAAGNEFEVASAQAGTIPGPRLMYSSNWSMAGTRYYSGGGWIYNYTRSRFLGQINPSSNANTLYSKGTAQANTPNYVFDWAVLPVLMPDNRVVLQIMDFVQDLTRTGAATPANVPNIKSNVNLLAYNNNVFSV